MVHGIEGQPGAGGLGGKAGVGPRGGDGGAIGGAGGSAGGDGMLGGDGMHETQKGGTVRLWKKVVRSTRCGCFQRVSRAIRACDESCGWIAGKRVVEDITFHSRGMRCSHVGFLHI